MSSPPQRDNGIALQLRTQNGEIALELREHVERHLGFALGRFGGRVGLVTVSLEDLNGLRGGLDQHSRIEIGLLPSGKVMAEATDVEVVAAVNRAAERIARRVRNELDRRRVTRWRCSNREPGCPEA